MAFVPTAWKQRNLPGNDNLAKVVHRMDLEPKVLAVVRECKTRL